MEQRLLHKKAERLRHSTKNWALHAKMDEEKVSVRRLAQNYILRPFAMLALEPILLLGRSATFALHLSALRRD